MSIYFKQKVKFNLRKKNFWEWKLQLRHFTRSSDNRILFLSKFEMYYLKSF